MAQRVQMTDGEMRKFYEQGGRIADLMEQTGLAYVEIQGRLQRVGTKLKTGGYANG